MAKPLKQTLVDIADAIRAKDGTSTTMTSQEMPARIAAIPSGGGGEYPHDINYFWPAGFYYNKWTSAEMLNTIKAGGDKHIYKDMSNMFNHCTNITTIPNIDTKNCENFGSMFEWCNNLLEIPLLDTANGRLFYSMFQNCYALKTIPLIDTSKATNMNNMFNRCTYLTSIPLLNTANVTAMMGMFSNCHELVAVPEINMQNVTNASNMFVANFKLKTLNMININKCDLNIKECSSFTDLSTVIGNLNNTSGSPKNFTISKIYHEKLLTQDDRDYIADAGYTLVVQ